MKGTGSSNVVRHQGVVTKQDYCRRNGHRSMALWFTGLSGAGKSTLAYAVHERIFRRGWHTYVLDGDNLRHGLNSDLGFGEAERQENIRRAGEVARLFVEAGVVVLAAFISPFAADRERVRKLFAPGEFQEVYVKCDLAVCETRDPKQLYRRARAGEIPSFTGISSPYEAPTSPELVVDTSVLRVETAVDRILEHIDRLTHQDMGQGAMI
ncbi:MAG: adenylyl-sulfate kinase [Verrucomicrobiales bacterium]|nr:adenylyl-sulfate kinase [Planctomycetota bacterium]MCP5524684.1 adenylyl-sulfate kinase [Verrucomicrobiales bacterium]